jgi:phage-related protein
VLATLRSEHTALETALRNRVNGLATGGVATAYANVRSSLEGTIPAFLRRTTPLTRDDIVSGLEELRPSRQAASIDELVNQFLRKLQPMLTAIEEPVNTFFASLQQVVRLIDPLSLRDAVASIYDTIRQRIRIIDPVALAQQIRDNLLQPVLSALGGLDPQALKARLDATFARVLHALSNAVRGILDEVAAVINEELQVLREHLASFAEQLTSSLRDAIEAIQRVIQRVEELVFVELLERLRTLLQNLEGSFGRELDRVRTAFDDMLNAIPLGGASQSASIG